MKYTTSQTKATRQTEDTSSRGSSVGQEAVSIAPPEYGLDFVDQGMAETAPTQRRCFACPGRSEGTPENRTGMPDRLMSGVEHLSGFGMSDVRVHYNSPKPAQLQALAYTQGTDIHVGPGQERHLPHEAWHVVQQKQGRVRPTMQLRGVNINDDFELEREADEMGAKAVRRPESGIIGSTVGQDPKTLQSKERWDGALTTKLKESNVPMSPVAQCTITEKKKNNTVTTRAELKKHRVANGKWNYTGCQKNFAIDMNNMTTYGFSDEGGHSERNLLNNMMIGGRAAGADVEIHTERETCLSCWNHLKGLHDGQVGLPGAFDMEISYTVDYPGDGDSKDKLYEYYRDKSGMP